MTKTVLTTIALSLTFLLTCLQAKAQEEDCTYFGLPVPGELPQDFNPQELALNGAFKYNVVINNCSEIYFTAITSSENIFYSVKQEGSWTAPELASFSHPNYNDADPFLSKDGNRVYFISKRPTNASDKNLDFNIWYADRENGDWAAPKPLPAPINTEEHDEYFFSISDKGNAFFSSNRTGGLGSFDIYTVKIMGENEYSDPQNVGGPLNTDKYEFDPYISPDERFMVFSINEKGNSSLYVSHKDKNDHWTAPRNLGEQINLTNQDFAPSLSEDGKYLFFSNNGTLRWVSTDLLFSPR